MHRIQTHHFENPTTSLLRNGLKGHFIIRFLVSQRPSFDRCGVGRCQAIALHPSIFFGGGTFSSLFSFCVSCFQYSICLFVFLSISCCTPSLSLAHSTIDTIQHAEMPTDAYPSVMPPPLLYAFVPLSLGVASFYQVDRLLRDEVMGRECELHNIFCHAHIIFKSQKGTGPAGRVVVMCVAGAVKSSSRRERCG